MIDVNPDLPAFYDAIRENPDDDGPLLIFADWLEEQGELDRANLIRVQVELAQPFLEGERADELRLQERRLLRSPNAKWKLPSPGSDLSWGALEKGVVRTLWARRPLELRTRLERILNFAPIHCVVLQHLISGDELALLQSASQMRRIRELRIPHQARRVNYVGAVCLAACPSLSELHKLSLAGTFIGAKGTRALAHFSTMKQLRVLELDESKVGMTGVKALFDSPIFRRLESLSLTNNQINPKAAAGFGGPVKLSALRDLNLGNNLLSDPGVAVLAKAPILGQLRSLNLESNRIGYNGIAALADSPHVRNLEKLNLAQNPFGGPAFARLAASAHFASLETLVIGEPRFTAREAAQLANSPYFPKLKTLILGLGAWDTEVLNLLKRRFGDNLRFGPTHWGYRRWH